MESAVNKGKILPPVYVLICLALGVAICLGSISSFVAPIILSLILRHRFSWVEEQMLRVRFGEEYLSYAARVRRWL